MSEWVNRLVEDRIKDLKLYIKIQEMAIEENNQQIKLLEEKNEESSRFKKQYEDELKGLEGVKMDKVTNENVLDAVVRCGDIFYTEEKTDNGTKVTTYIALPIPKSDSYMNGLQLYDIKSLIMLDDCDFDGYTRGEILDDYNSVFNCNNEDEMFFLGDKETYRYNISIERRED